MVLTLTLGRRARGKGKAEGNSLPRRPNVAETRAAPKPQHAARFRKLGKLRFPNLRREADGQQKRWEAKRSRQMSLAAEKPLTVRPLTLP